MKIALRILIGLLVVAALGVALIPLFVLIDLSDGGTGWGLCEAGVATCRNSYFAGFELVALLAATLFVIVGLIGLFAKLLRWVERREKERRDPELLVG